MYWIIVDLKKGTALYAIGQKTLKFSSYENANEVARQFFESDKDYETVRITE